MFESTEVTFSRAGKEARRVTRGQLVQLIEGKKSQLELGSEEDDDRPRLCRFGKEPRVVRSGQLVQASCGERTMESAPTSLSKTYSPIVARLRHPTQVITGANVT